MEASVFNFLPVRVCGWVSVSPCVCAAKVRGWRHSACRRVQLFAARCMCGGLCGVKVWVWGCACACACACVRVHACVLTCVKLGVTRGGVHECVGSRQPWA